MWALRCCAHHTVPAVYVSPEMLCTPYSICSVCEAWGAVHTIQHLQFMWALRCCAHHTASAVYASSEMLCTPYSICSLWEPDGGGWMIFHFSIVFHFVFLLIESIVLFTFLIKYYNIMFIIIIVFWLCCDRPSGFIFLCPLYFIPYSRLFSYLFRLFILFLLYPCSSVWENTRVWVPHFL